MHIDREKETQWLALMALRGLEGYADINKITIQMKVNCNYDKCHEQVHNAMTDNNTDIWPPQVILRQILRNYNWTDIPKFKKLLHEEEGKAIRAW